MLNTAVIYDESMADYHCLWDPSYVEKPERFTCILERCKELGILNRCINLKPRKATEKELLTAHSPKLVDFMKKTAEEKDAEVLKRYSSKFDCIYLHPNSYKAALISAGSAIELTEAVLSGKARNGFGILRPPGHHAMYDEICGYCYFNNVVLAAKHALNKGKKKILIVDWDVHHGQGTQRAFYDDPRVIYFSIHRFEDGTWWPELKESDFNAIGTGKGTGFNINVPLNKIGNEDKDYLAVFTQILLPVAIEFQPDFVLVSAGYDPALGCIEGEQEVSPAFFAHMTNMLSGLADGQLVALLEGGYCLTSLAEGAAFTIKTLLGDPVPKLLTELGQPCKEIQATIDKVRYILAPFWNSFKTLELDPKVDDSTIWKGPEGPPPTEYDPMCPTPPRPEKVEEEYERRLKVLEENTDLSRCDYRVSVSNDKLKQWSVGQIGVDMAAALLFVSSSEEVLENVLSCKSQAGLIFSTKYQVKKELKNLKTLEISLVDDSNEIELVEHDGMRIVIGSCKEKSSKFDIAIPCTLNDSTIVQILLRVLLPLSYFYKPDLILVHYSCGSISFASFLSHYLSGVSNGKIIHWIGQNQNQIDVQSLIGNLMKLTMKTPKGINFERNETLERITKNLVEHWPSLNLMNV